MEPLLAESFEQNDDNVEVTFNPDARWSDGKPVTGWDVKFSFDLGDKNKSLPMAPGLAVHHRGPAARRRRQRSRRHADRHARLPAPRRSSCSTKDKLNPLIVLDSLQDVRIIPRHVFEPMLDKSGLDDGHQRSSSTRTR